MASTSHGADGKCFDITHIQTETFSIPKDYLTPDKNRRFLSLRPMAELHIPQAESGCRVNLSDGTKPYLALHYARHRNSRCKFWKSTRLGRINLSRLSLCPMRCLVRLETNFCCQARRPHHHERYQSHYRPTLFLHLQKQPLHLNQVISSLPGQPSNITEAIGNARSHLQEANGTIQEIENPSGLVPGVASAGFKKDPDTVERVVTSPNDFPYKWKIVRERVAFVASAAVINIAY